MLQANASIAEQRASSQDSNKTGLLKDLLIDPGDDQPYSLPLPPAVGPRATLGWSRVVTLVNEHGTSRRAALRNLQRPEFEPGSVSDCYYDPAWSELHHRASCRPLLARRLGVWVPPASHNPSP